MLRRIELAPGEVGGLWAAIGKALLVIRWFLDATRVTQLAADNGIGKSTAYDYLHEGIDILAACAPDLDEAALSVSRGSACR